MGGIIPEVQRAFLDAVGTRPLYCRSTRRKGLLIGIRASRPISPAQEKTF